MAKNYYEILGVDKNATQDQIKSQYRKLAKTCHPDLHPNDKEAEAKFKELNEANEVLSDPQKRQQYDFELEHPGASQGGFGGFGGFSGGGFDGFGDIFSDIFGGGFSGSSSRQRTKKGSNIEQVVYLSFMDAAKGCKKDINYRRTKACSTCHGTGAKNGTEYSTCSTCHGTGQVKKTMSVGGLFTTVNVVTCSACGGSGKIIKEKCPDCSGRGVMSENATLSVNIPAGCDDNSYIQKRGFGNAIQGGEAGDLIIVFKIEPHKIFTRKGNDIYITLPIPFTTAVLGGKVTVPTIDEPYIFNIPEGTQSGKIFVVRRRGIRFGNNVGDLYITINVETPSKLTREQKEMLQKLNFDDKQCQKISEFKQNSQSLFGIDPYKK